MKSNSTSCSKPQEDFSFAFTPSWLKMHATSALSIYSPDLTLQVWPVIACCLAVLEETDRASVYLQAEIAGLCCTCTHIHTHTAAHTVVV